MGQGRSRSGLATRQLNPRTLARLYPHTLLREVASEPCFQAPFQGEIEGLKGLRRTQAPARLRLTREEAQMIEAFEFADGDKTYRCQVRLPAGSGEPWWWFTVSGDQQNYAPF